MNFSYEYQGIKTSQICPLKIVPPNKDKDLQLHTVKSHLTVQGAVGGQT